MIAGLSGPLFSHDAIEGIIRSAAIPALASAPPAAAIRGLRAWHAGVRDRLGPACGPRTVFDLVGEPLAKALGFGVVPIAAGSDLVDALLQVGNLPAAVMIVSAWGQPPSTMWRHGVHRGLAHGTRWSLCVSGPAVRLFEVDRAYARRYAEFNLEAAIGNERTLAVLWALLHATAVVPGAGGGVLDRAIALCEQHRTEVRLSLRHGVHDALLQLVTAFRLVTRARSRDAGILDESLIVIYRILFLLFAEARGLVPAWHPVYRDGYTIEALRRQLGERALPAGIWEALQAIARLAHRGCRAGPLRVPPFNGRLFSPSDAPLADAVPLDDQVVARALAALTTRKGKGGPEPISYADLGVEQLGSVYEHLLDYDLAHGVPGARAALVPTGRRKATGSFYTPRALTEFLVRRTLAPLVRDASPARILALRVLDPAMGSGAFLVAACRYLAAAYEQALLREGALAASDVTEEDRAAFRRAVAQKCLFGVDLNPMAVQLGRLSLWLATLAADRPLTFLDHRLRVGNSLVGASMEDILRHPAPGLARRTGGGLPLFQTEELQASLESAVESRTLIAETPDDTLEQVRDKERALAVLNRPGGPLDRWRAAADVWCASWYPGRGQPAGRAMFRALLDRIMQGAGTLPDRLADALLAQARSVAAHQRFFHWTFEFPEIFYDGRGAARPDGGFDVVIANPPWEMLREECGAARASELHAFVRGSGSYPRQGHGHSNLYQLFVDRIVRLLRPTGRVGLILPAGFSTDHACGALRRFLFDRTSVDTFTTLENRDGIFPIHRALKFLLLTFTAGGSTTELPARPGLRSPDVLDTIADQGADLGAIRIPRALIERASGPGLAVPEIRLPADLDILSAVSFRTPVLGDDDGWGVHFGRELNATDDRPHFREDGQGLPVIEGKHLRPFAVDAASVRYTIPDRTAARLLNADLTFRRPRLAYRDVASATNRTSLIAAIVPPGVVTTHTVLCLKETLDAESQHFLCAVFNSYVANYFVRMRIGTHVTAAIIARLPVPRPATSDRLFQRIAALGAAAARAQRAEDVARLNGMVARLYRLSSTEFGHVLQTFPLIPEPERSAAHDALQAEAAGCDIL